MTFALILTSNIAVGRAIRNRLEPIGFDRLIQIHTDAQALAVSRAQRPDLIVVGDPETSGIAASTIRTIAERSKAPVLLATADAAPALRMLAGASIASGPFPLQ